MKSCISKRSSCQQKLFDPRVENKSVILYRGPKVQGIKRLGLKAGRINLAFGDEAPFVQNQKKKRKKKTASHKSSEISAK